MTTPEARADCARLANETHPNGGYEARHFAGNSFPPSLAFANFRQLSADLAEQAIADPASAATILKPLLLPKPVDPDHALAVELVLSEAITRTDNQIAAIRSGQAGQEKVALALAAIKRGRELERNP